MEEKQNKRDLDFDELDKAVSSLMGKVGGEVIDDGESTKTLEINSTLNEDEKPKYDALGKAAESIGHEALTSAGEKTNVENVGSEVPTSEMKSAQLNAVNDHTPPQEETPKPPAAKRPRSGRFMDMVHPSADMRGVAPLPDLVVPERPKPKTEKDDEDEEKAVPTPEEKDITTPTPTEALLTPFLPDAKVEKRPLGGVAATEETAALDTADTETAHEEDAVPKEDDSSVGSEAEEPVETASVNNEDKEKDDGSGDEQRPLNATEFDEEPSSEEKELQAIESTEVTESDERSPKPDKAPESILTVESGDTEKLSADAKTDPPAKKKDAKSEKVGTHDTSAGIYDVNNYSHPPIAHQAKRKSGWGTVVLIVIIIVLCIGLAGGAYLLLDLGA